MFGRNMCQGANLHKAATLKMSVAAFCEKAALHFHEISKLFAPRYPIKIE